MSKLKPIHLIIIRYGSYCRAVCNKYTEVTPFEATLKQYSPHNAPNGTFDPGKVTCKRCLKHTLYKEALDKVNHPLFYWRENT